MIRRDPGRRRHPGRARHRGQSLVEFALILPTILVMLVGLIDFGFLFYTNMTLEYATREGARVGSALAAGNGTKLPCADVDNHVIAAVQRVLESAGINVRLDPSVAAKGGVQWIRIYKATGIANGSGYAGTYNQWEYATSGAPTVDGAVLKFKRTSSLNWDACSRKNGNTPDSIGVAISYNHAWIIPTGPLFGGTFALLDKTVMVLNPTYP